MSWLCLKRKFRKDIQTMAMDLLSELDSCGRLELLMKQMQNESVNLKGAPLL